MDSRERVDRLCSQLTIIWFAFLASLAVYLLVGILLEGEFGPGMDPSMVGPLRLIALIYGIAVLFLSRFARSFMLNSGIGSTAPAPQRYMSALILAWALSESIAITGLVVFILGRVRLDLYLAVAVSAIALLLNRPNRDDMALGSDPALG